MSDPEAIPEVKKLPLAGIFLAWFIVVSALLTYFLKVAFFYDPEHNGMYNSLEAALRESNFAVLTGVAATAVFTSLGFAVAIIMLRLRNLGEINRAGHLAILSELRTARQPERGPEPPARTGERPQHHRSE